MRATPAATPAREFHLARYVTVRIGGEPIQRDKNYKLVTKDNPKREGFELCMNHMNPYEPSLREGNSLLMMALRSFFSYHVVETHFQFCGKFRFCIRRFSRFGRHKKCLQQSIKQPLGNTQFETGTIHATCRAFRITCGRAKMAMMSSWMESAWAPSCKKKQTIILRIIFQVEEILLKST